LSGTGVVSTVVTVPPPSATAWKLNGTAAIVSGALRLTSTSPTNQRGSAFYPTAVSSASLTIDFDATISGGSDGDGMTFTFANPSAGASALGASGSGLGYAGINGIAVGLDTLQSWGSNDPSNNYVGIANGFNGGNTDNLNWLATATNVPNLRSGTHHFTITTNNGTIVVKVDGTQYLSTAVTLPSTVLVGFTGGTGDDTQNQTVANVVITAG